MELTSRRGGCRALGLNGPGLTGSGYRFRVYRCLSFLSLQCLVLRVSKRPHAQYHDAEAIFSYQSRLLVGSYFKIPKMQLIRTLQR